jgi:hemolysin III
VAEGAIDVGILRSSPIEGYSRREEFANSASHFAGLAAAFVGVPVLVTNATERGDAAYFAGVCIFSATVFLLYLASAIYHGLPEGKAKKAFLVLDHASIYLLIAGTYTPFTLGVLRGSWGWTLFVVIWALAIAGVLLKVTGRASNPIISTGMYVLMGWLVVFALKPLVARVPQPGLLWLLAGGLFYTTGIVFYATSSRLRYGHLIWHLFVVAGTACHYFAVLWYAA